MELAAQIPPEQRATTPLFGPAPGEEFTHAQLDSALQLLLVEGAGVLEGDLHNYSVCWARLQAWQRHPGASQPFYTRHRYDVSRIVLRDR